MAIEGEGFENPLVYPEMFSFFILLLVSRNFRLIFPAFFLYLELVQAEKRCLFPFFFLYGVFGVPSAMPRTARCWNVLRRKPKTTPES